MLMQMHTTQTLVQLFNFRVILKCCWTTSIEFLVWRIEKWLIKFIRVVSHDYPMQQQHISLITWPRQTRRLRQPIFLPLFAHLDLVAKKVIELQVPCKKNYWCIPFMSIETPRSTRVDKQKRISQLFFMRMEKKN